MNNLAKNLYKFHFDTFPNIATFGFDKSKTHIKNTLFFLIRCHILLILVILEINDNNDFTKNCLNLTFRTYLLFELDFIRSKQCIPNILHFRMYTKIYTFVPSIWGKRP